MVRARRRTTIGLAAALLSLGGLAACEPTPPPTTFTVNRFTDGPDAAPGDGTCEVTLGQGDCSLRAAVDEGNATDGPVHIGFVPTEQFQTFDSGSLDVSSSMTIAGPATVSGQVSHTAGNLVLRDVVITGAESGDLCGSAVQSVGGSLALDRVILELFAHRSRQPLVCATGALTIIDTTIDGLDLDTAVVSGGRTILYRSAIRGATVGLDLSGAPSFAIVNSTIDGLRTGTSVGDIAYTWLTGELGPTSTVWGSIVDCRSTSTATSAGYNLDIGGACGLDDPTDQAPPTKLPSTIDLTRPPRMLVAHAVDSPSIDAIPAGTPGLCDGTWAEDQTGGRRMVGAACDIGPIEAQVSIRLGTEDHRPVVPDTPVRVNAGGTVAATFPGTGGAPSAVGRWAIDGTFTSSEVTGSRVNDIGDDGTVVGYVIDTDGVRHAWRWFPDGSSELVTGPHGTTTGELFAIDHDGTIVGASEGVPWWQAPGGEPVALPAMEGSPHVAAVRGGIAVGHTGHGPSIATVWHLSAGTATTLPHLAAHDERSAPSLAFDVTPDGTVIGEIDGRVVAWPDGGSPTLAAMFTSPLTGGVVGSLPIVVGQGNVRPESAILYLLTEQLTEVRLVLGLNPQHLSDGGHLVGTRRVGETDPTAREVVRLPLTITP